MEYSEYGKRKIEEAIEQYKQGLFKVWMVIADYRTKNEHRPKYCVIANSAREAKKYVTSVMEYMKVYDCVEVDETMAKEILSDPFNRVFNYERVYKGEG